jgi:hypothetical protein
MSKPALSERIKAGIQGIALGVAKFAGYNAAMPNKVQAPATRTGTNPNSSYAQQQRVRLSFEGENAIKNTSFARNYINKRRMYCSSGITYAPDTGDHALDEAVSAYCMEQWKHMGVGCSMQQAFARASDVNLPERGDSALQWYRDEGRLRLLEVTADRIGELYQFTRPVRDVRDGEVYFSGLYLQGPNTTAYRIYERGFDSIYTNPQRVEAQDIIFFKDDITGGVRGVSIFASALEDVNSRYQILKSTKDTMQQQSKIAAIVSNNSGQPNELDYETQVSSEGAVEYVETMADGAIVKYQFNGDNYQVLKGEHPSDSFINGMRYLDASASLAVGFPYEFLFSGALSGGAPFRGAFEAAGREIMRLRNDIHRPRLDVISYVTIMDGVERKKLPPMPNIARGCWGFTTLPTADAFRDDASDIKAIRSGITTKSAVIMANSGRSFPVVLRESMQEAVATAMAVEDANRALVKAGYKPSVTIADIAQVSDNPQQAAAAENLTQGKPAEGTPAKPAAAAMADFEESKHPRADDGKFGEGGGGAKNEEAPKNEASGKSGDGDKEKATALRNQVRAEANEEANTALNDIVDSGLNKGKMVDKNTMITKAHPSDPEGTLFRITKLDDEGLPMGHSAIPEDVYSEFYASKDKAGMIDSPLFDLFRNVRNKIRPDMENLAMHGRSQVQFTYKMRLREFGPGAGKTEGLVKADGRNVTYDHPLTRQEMNDMEADPVQSKVVKTK